MEGFSVCGTSRQDGMQGARQTNLQMPGDNKKAMTLWALQDAEDQGLNHYDIGRAQQVQDRSQVRLDV